MRALLRRWKNSLLRGYRAPVEPGRAATPIQTGMLADAVKGQWVAMHNGEVVEAGATFHEVMVRLHDRDITNVTVMRVPAEQEAELVGLG